jgi:hypothetical protein
MGTWPVAAGVAVVMPISVSACISALVASPMTQVLPPVLVTVAIIAVEVAIGIVVPVTVMLTSIPISIPTRMVAAASPITIVVESIDGIDQRVCHGRANQQVQCCVAVVVRTRTQRNCQADSKPSSSEPFQAVIGGSKALSNGIHHLVLFQQCNARMRCGG